MTGVFSVMEETIEEPERMTECNKKRVRGYWQWFCGIIKIYVLENDARHMSRAAQDFITKRRFL